MTWFQSLKKKLHKAKHFTFNAHGPVPRKKVSIMIEVTCTDAQKFRVQVMPTTASGKASKIEAGTLSVTADPGGLALNAIATVESDDTFTVQADFPPDTASVDQTFTVTGDADLGSGVTTISDAVLLHVVSETASNLNPTAVGAVPR